MALSENPNLALIPSGYKAGKIYSVLPTNGVGDFNFARGTIATRINSSGLIEEVASNVPRLNYPLIDGVVKGCPHHILEPQRLQRVQYSEDFSNSVWDNSNQITRTASATISPDGTLNAFNIKPTDVNSNHTLRAQNLGGFTNGAVVSASFFAKQNGYKYISVVGGFGSSNTPSVIFNLEDGLIESGTGTIENYGNGWYRCITPITLNSTSLYCVATILNDNLLGSFPGDNTKGIYVYGFQIEEGSFATSYIPNYGTAAGVTRSAETANGSGDASTFNDSEGVLMAEISAFGETVAVNNWITISDETSNNYIAIQQETTGYVIARVKSGGSTQALMSSLINQDIISKIAVKYKENDFSLYINGFELGSDNSGSVFSSNTLTKLHLNYINVSNDFYGNTKQLQYYDTALTDSELETLTSWVSFTDMAEGQQYTIE